MKLLIRSYLASLRERGELDAILPDIVSELGLVVISRPSIGTRQQGVDLAAVGNDRDHTRKLFLFVIKAGDITRQTWTGGTNSLRASIEDILDAYIPNRVSPEHATLPIVICLCFGGDIQENVRENVVGYMRSHCTDKLEFQEWNGDKLAQILMSGVLNEELMPEEGRSYFRKSVAMVDEPTASYTYLLQARQVPTVETARHRTTRHRNHTPTSHYLPMGPIRLGT